MRRALLCICASCAIQPTCGETRYVKPHDARIDEGGDVYGCDPLLQTCPVGEKCTWIIDATDATSWVGHITCEPIGVKQTGSACIRGAPGIDGYDDCIQGDYCVGPPTGGSGTCEAICDVKGGPPACGSAFGCKIYDGIFGPIGMPVEAGLCVPTCDPLGDNNFLGSAGSGCYGLPGSTDGPTIWEWLPQLNYSRVHRTPCDAIMHPGDLGTCATGSGAFRENSCAAGYEPIYLDAEGTTAVECLALCQPASCYNTGSGSASGSSSCGTGSDVNITGTAPYQCAAQRLQYAAFDSIDPTMPWSSAAPTTNNGEQCLYSWLAEFDSSGNFVGSPTSDFVGFCFDHAILKFDPMGGSNENTVWPRCDYIGLGSGGYNVHAYDAAAFGCIDTATARAAGELSFSGKATFTRPALRVSYH